MSTPSNQYNHNSDPTDLQGQIQGQLQGQLQGQANLQGQASRQDQASLQGQGQQQSQSEAQTAAQAVAQYADSSNENSNGNVNGNLSGNANGNANGNLNGNENVNSNELSNAVSNSDTNEVSNSVTNTVTSAVNVSVAVDLGAFELKPVLDASINVAHNDGIAFSMPDSVDQYVTGDGNNALFNLDQVNTLVDSDYLGSASVSFSAGAFDYCDPVSQNAPAVFSQTASAWGGASSADHASATAHDGSPASVAASADAPVSQDAFTQSITMGANIQFNSASFDVVGHDTITTDGGAMGTGHHG